MAWIHMIPEDEAEGDLKELYDKFTSPEGQVDHILKIHGLNPPSLLGHYDFYKTVMRGRSPLSRIQREMIAVVTSSANRCHY
jgi:alkylhydroperoxidase family enzyme